MSNDGSATGKPSVSAKDIQAQFDDALAKRKQFDELVVLSNSAIEESKTSVTTARNTALAEIDKAKIAITTAKGGVEALLAEVSTAKAAVDAAKASALADIEQSKAAVTAAKGATDSILAEIDKAKTTVATAKGAIEATQTASSADLASISESKVTADKLQAAALAQAERLSVENATISDKIGELQKKAAPLEEILTTLTSIKEEAETARASITADIAKIAEAKANFENLNTQTQQQHDALVTRKVALDTQIAEIGTSHERIKEISKLLFDDTADRKSVRSEIEALRAQITKILRESTEERDVAQQLFDEFKADTEKEKKALVEKLTSEFKQLHDALEGEIRALLPSAGAAGLASTYYDAKSRYAPTSFAAKPGGSASNDSRLGWDAWWGWWRRRFGYNPASVVATVFFYGLFIFPILGIVFIFYDLVRDLPKAGLANLDFRILTLRVLIALPLATISAFGFTSLRLYRRLYEEYNHKQRVMELYASFRKEIAENGTEEQKRALLTIMLNAVADKSYLATGAVEGKGEEEILAKVNTIASLLNNLTKLKVS